MIDDVTQDPNGDFTVQSRLERESRIQRRKNALQGRGVWACPACQYGWEVYMIQSDMHICSNPQCRYQGGDPLAHKPPV